MGKVAGAALLSAALVAGAVAHAGVVVIDVQEADGSRVVVPVPLAVARAGVALAPEEVKRLDAPGFAPYPGDVDRAAEALIGAPDGTLVRVLDGDQRVTVTKEGDLVHVRVIEGEETAADVLVPLRSVEAAVRAYDARERHFRTSGLLAALRTAPRGDLVDVLEGEERIRIRRLF